MDLEDRWKCQETSMKGILKTIKRMEKAKYCLQMGIYMKDNLPIIYMKVMESTTSKIKIGMKDSGPKGIDREKENFSNQLDSTMRVSGKTTKRMALESKSTRTNCNNSRDILKMISKMAKVHCSIKNTEDYSVHGSRTREREGASFISTTRMKQWK